MAPSVGSHKHQSPAVSRHVRFMAFQSPRFVKIKRKASESGGAPVGFKKFKFLGSSESGDTSALKRLIAEKRPALAQFEEDLLITDYEDFVFEQSNVAIPSNSEGEILIASQAFDCLVCTQ